MCKDSRIAFGGLVVFAVWVFVILPVYHDSSTEVWLAIFTAVLAVSTIGLWFVTWDISANQSRETRIIQRAYISVSALGLGPHKSDDKWADVRVEIQNVGRLPATKVRWVVCRKFSCNPELSCFPINERRLEGSGATVSPGIKVKKATIRISYKRIQTFIKGLENRNRFLYVWGIVRYQDGFEKDRFTNFCHRYNLAALGTVSSFQISADDARIHEYGYNDAD